MEHRIGLALGGGGAKGLTHVNFLEVIEEHQIPIHQIAGTSIGAIFGACYAAGLTPREMREYVESLSYNSETIFGRIAAKNVFKWFSFIDMQIKSGALFNVDEFLDTLMDLIKVKTFEELNIPLKIVASDFWLRKEKVFSSGELRTAIQASMALPVLFHPVIQGDTVLIDGGAVNPVPYDLLDDCDIRIAINVMGERESSDTIEPTLTESLFNTFQILQNSILQEKLKNSPPDILITPELTDIQTLDFLNAQQILAQGDSYKPAFGRKLDRMMATV